MAAGEPAPDRTERLLGALVAALGGISALTFLSSAAVRLGYPFELEWLESETLQHVTRVLEGKPLHAAPAAAFAATIYPPLYAWLSALVARLTEVSFLAPRLVSALATVASGAIAARAAARLGGGARGGFIAGALLLAAYVPCGTVFDLARLDALWVFFLLAATAAEARAERVPGPGPAVASGMLLALATATKQPAVLLALGLGAALWPRARRSALLLLATWITLTAAYYAGLHLATGGWSTFYLAVVPLSVAHQTASWLHLVRDDLLRNFAPAIAILLTWTAVPRSARPGDSLSLVWRMGLFVALAMTASMRTLQGGWLNGLVPAVAFGAVLTGAIAGRVLGAAAPPARRALLAALAVQFAMLIYAPASLVPSEVDRQQGAALVERIRALPGEVWIPSHNSYAYLAGKPFLVHRDPLLDLLYSGASAFPEDLIEKLRTGSFAAVIADGAFAEPRLQQALEAGYALETRIEDAPAPLVGYRTRPALLYRPR
jgi:hypothetical protein